MPIYEYQCQKCGIIEVSQRITEKPLVKCPTCKSKIKKLISNTSFQLKGTGWYVTDYPSESRKKAMSSEKSAGDGNGKPAESSTTSATSEKVSSSSTDTKD